MMNRIRLGVTLMVFGAAFGILETIYFGGNLVPKSIPELLCDIFAIVAFMLGYNILYPQQHRNE